MRSQIFTTFEIARLLEVGPSTVIAWVNEGKLDAFRTPGGHRRVKREVLIDFLREFKMPVPEELLEPTQKILIVDDDPIVVRQLKHFAEEIGEDVRVTTVMDGFSAGEMVATLQPELVILDIFLPGIDGFEVCRKIRANPLTRHTKVLAVTGRATRDVVKEILEAGADAVLSKPIVKEIFLKKIAELYGVQPGTVQFERTHAMQSKSSSYGG